MAQRVSGRVKVGSTYVDVLFPTHIKGVVGLLSGEKINRFLLPEAKSNELGAVKLSSAYNVTTPDADTALSQSGAKELYKLIQNLESPIDYIAANVTSLSGANTSGDRARIRTELNAFISSWFNSDFPTLVLRPGHAILLTNSQNAYLETSAEVNVNIKGSWLYIYDGEVWNPAINFPEVGRADDSGATLDAMVEGIITKAMLWKLKGIEAGAQKNTITGVKGDSESTYRTGNVNITKANIGLANVPNIDATNASNISSGTLPPARLPVASASTRGGVLLASESEAKALTNPNNTKALTPATGQALADFFSTLKIYTELPDITSQPEGKIFLKLEEVIDHQWIPTTWEYFDSQPPSNRTTLYSSTSPEPEESANGYPYGFAVQLFYDDPNDPETPPVDFYFKVG